jgi:hypothetical protein
MDAPSPMTSSKPCGCERCMRGSGATLSSISPPSWESVRRPSPGGVLGMITGARRLDPPLGRAPSVGEPDHPFRAPPQVRRHEADTGEQLARVPFDLGHHPPSTVPRLRPIPEAVVEDLRLLRGATHRALQQVDDVSLQDSESRDVGPTGGACTKETKETKQFRTIRRGTPLFR